MFKEQYSRSNMSEGHMDAILSAPEHEIFVPKFKGIVKDVAFDAVTGKQVWERDWDSNIVVQGMSTVIAALIAQASGYSGATWWAVGSGNVSWDTTPVTPNATDTSLVQEVYRKQISAGSIIFTDSSGNPLSAGQISNNIQIQLTFQANEANYSLREFAIYGGNATSTQSSGIMLNHKIHPRIDKTSAILLQRTIRFTF